MDSGKSTLVEAITGKWPAVHSEELKRGITIKLGYADATIYRCKKCKRFMTSDKCLSCAEVCEAERTVSFVDAPGHETLMATVIAGASLMDGAILIIAADEKCPQPQTVEHLTSLEIAGIKHIVIAQNKVDLVTPERARESYSEIKAFIKGTIAEKAPIIPVSAQKKINIDLMLDAIQEHIPTPERKTGDARMYIVRSFDVNKPGTDIKKLHGGVIGGAIKQGALKVGDEIEIRPGVKVGEKWQTLKANVVGLQKAGMDLDEAGAGGLLGLMTTLDPGLTKADSLSGNVAGKNLPPVLNRLRIRAKLFKDLVGREGKIDPIKLGEPLMINVGTARTIGMIKSQKKDTVEIDLKLPVCAEAGERAVLSRRIGDRWRLIGFGDIQ